MTITALHQKLTRFAYGYLSNNADSNVYNIQLEADALVDWLESDYNDLNKLTNAELKERIEKTWKVFGKLAKKETLKY